MNYYLFNNDADGDLVGIKNPKSNKYEFDLDDKSDRTSFKRLSKKAKAIGRAGSIELLYLK